METLIGLALKSLLVAAVTLGLLYLTRRRSASERSLIAHLGLVALVALPLASLALPALHVDLPQVMASSEIEPVAVAEADLPAIAPVEESATPVAASSTWEAPSTIDLTSFLYAIPAVALILVTLLALLRLVALKSRAQVLVDPVWLGALAHAQRRMGFKNGTALLTSSELSSPISWGLMRPVILLNDEALGATGEAEAIIAHELAHVARLDWIKLLLARVATAVFWFNPLAWVLAREAHQLREEAADDAVLAANIADTDYAQLLVGIARHECKGLLLGAHGVAPSKGSLTRRVRRVLDGTLARGTAAPSWIAGFAAGMLVMSAPLAALTFQQPEAEPADETAPDMASMPAPIANPVEPAIAETVTRSVMTSTAIARNAAEVAVSNARIVDTEALRREIATSIERRRDRKLGGRDPVDTAIGMKVMGVTPEYVAAMRAASPRFRNLNPDEMIEMKAMGVTPEFVRSMAVAGFGSASADEIGEAAVLRVTPDYVRGMRAAGQAAASLEELGELRTLGITPDFVRRVKAAGHRTLSAEQLIKLRMLGMVPRAPTPPLPPAPHNWADQDSTPTPTP
ncbi:M56 family metallopeptidase [Sphingomonas sp. LY160]|uniref:M56 family metallopeptidase n=1 Tax=Sphingomonas sp. LY160 TaxID=3095342 RepID=UPI002ADED5B5|nr:M56 family metallopeptidase [Sphingomonas sp. LY160]MEA1072858.1 M56 family metallopeptidase [Sphingomonas sp. LY160]